MVAVRTKILAGNIVGAHYVSAIIMYHGKNFREPCPSHCACGAMTKKKEVWGVRYPVYIEQSKLITLPI